ncbi:MAG TPA: 1,4-alpha-glucan branching protein domain-containing protein [Solirubrobacterales bacterium]|nr:1,4-alpha-glucan branching protein domain-containing protein [Solirubrobacterales bacterium]
MQSVTVGSLAIVLHSHMPYVEGFGTYPFGEEWLFDAFVRSHLPVLRVADGVTVTVTPVLADQLEADGVADRLASFVEEFRVGSCMADAGDMEGDLGRACEVEAERYRAALDATEGFGGDLLEAFREPAAAGRIELVASAATHAVMPMLATDAGRELQLETGLRSHRRRFGPSAGIWLPECAYEPALDELLAAQDIRWFCTDQSTHEPEQAALAPVRTPAGPVALTIDWGAISWLWSIEGYPSDPAYVDFHRESLRGARPWAISGNPYVPEAGQAVAREQAASFVASLADRLGRYRAERGKAGLVVFAIDTELLGHWWWEGPTWFAEVLRLAPEQGIDLVTASEAVARHEPEERPLRRSTWGEGKDLRTWDAPAVADLAWAARRLELRTLRALGEGLEPRCAERAVRELLALQASDWAFLDSRKQAGDYPWQRSTDHAKALLQAIDCAAPTDPRLRNLAPDLSLTRLLRP